MTHRLWLSDVASPGVEELLLEKRLRWMGHCLGIGRRGGDEGAISAGDRGRD